VDIVYLDFAKAFDTVCHSKLILKLQAFGITGRLLGWIRAFLGNRSQLVKVGSSYSVQFDAPSGVPQGSVLGPLLFVAYVNDLPSVVHYSVCKIFADDTKLFLRANGVDVSQLHLLDDLRSVLSWADIWQLSLSLSKCLVMHLGNRAIRLALSKFSYSLGNVVLPVVTSARDLGFIFLK
jgi:ribonucleases P/MRP protein subunit RPP40